MTSINFDKISDTITSFTTLPPDQEKEKLEVILNAPGYINTFLPKNNRALQEKFVAYLFQRLEQAQKDESRLSLADLYKKGLRVCVRYAKEFFSTSSSIEGLKKSFICRFATQEVKLPLALLQIYKIDLIFNKTFQNFQEGQKNEIQFEGYGQKTPQLFEQFIRTQSLSIEDHDATYDDIIELLHLHSFSTYCQFEELEQYTIDILISILSRADNAVYWGNEEVQRVLSSNSNMCFEILKQYLTNIGMYYTERKTKVYIDPRALILIKLPCMRFHIGGIYIRSRNDIPDIIKTLENITDKDSIKNQIQALYCNFRDVTPKELHEISRLFPLLTHLEYLKIKLSDIKKDVFGKIMDQAIKEQSKEGYQALLLSLIRSCSNSSVKQFVDFIDQEGVFLDSKNPYCQKLVALLFNGILGEKQNSPKLKRIKKLNDEMIQEETEQNLLNRFLARKYELFTELRSKNTLNIVKITQLLKELSYFVLFDNNIFYALTDNNLYTKIEMLMSNSERVQFCEQLKQYFSTYIEMFVKEDPNYISASYCIGVVLTQQSAIIVGKEEKLDLLKQAQECFQKVLAINPNHQIANYNLGSVLFEQPKLMGTESSEKLELLKLSQKHFQKDLAINPNNQIANCNLGSVLFEQSKLMGTESSEKLELLKFAQDCCQKALAINPNDVDTNYQLGSIILERGRIMRAERSELLKQAQECFQRVLAINLNNVRTNYKLGYTFLEQSKIMSAEKPKKLKLLEKAQECFQRVLAINPNDMMGTNYKLGYTFLEQSKIMIAEMPKKLELLEKAQECCQKSLAINPSNDKANSLMDDILLEVGKISTDEAKSTNKKRKRVADEDDELPQSKKSKI